MSKTGKAKRGRGAPAKATPRPAPVRPADPGADKQAPAAKPFKPRRALFLVLCGVFVLWVALLLVLYFTTVYPRRAAPAEQQERSPAAVEGTEPR